VHLAGLDGRPYVLAIGAKEPRKNLPRLIDAFGLLQRQLPELALVLLGPDGPDGPAIDDAISRQPRGAAAHILLVDYVSDADRNAILHGAAALAYPSLDEGFGFPALEAMAAGVGRPLTPARCRRSAARRPSWSTPQPGSHGRRPPQGHHRQHGPRRADRPRPGADRAVLRGSLGGGDGRPLP
jgi:hypothetical protein